MSYKGDFQRGATLFHPFTMVNASGTPTQLAGSPVIKVYKDDETGTEAITGVTLTVDHDTTTGANMLKVVMTDAFYTAGHDYHARVTTGTVDGNSVVGYVPCTWSIENRPPVGVVRAAAVTGTLSTTEMTTDLTEATDDHYNGRRIVWTGGVLKDQATIITDYVGSTKKLVYVATTEAPSNGDPFIIV